MNSLGRHYRDPAHPDNPTCDHELNSVKCTFFTTENEFSSLPYPSDITTGPVSDPPAVPASSQADMSAILALLQQQKADTDKQMSSLQAQVSSILQDRVPTPVPTGNPAQVPQSQYPVPAGNPALVPQSQYLPSAPPLPIFTTPTTTAPHVVASAAASLSAALQSGLGQSHNYGYTGLTMDNLRSNPVIVTQAASVLSNATQNIPPLNPNPLLGMGAALGNLQSNQVINSVDQLYQATTVNKQLRAYEFASTGQFPYRNQLKQDNCNAVTFAYGAFKHLEACKSGLIKNMSDIEFLARLRHLKNVFEIACLSSSLSSYSDPSWQIAREYDSRVIADIEAGTKSWDTMTMGLETDSIYCAKETVELRNKKKPRDLKNPKKEFEEKPKKDPKKYGCTTYNTHRASDGCYWEHLNKGETCVFEHFCSWCKANRNVSEKHKALNCEFKTD